MECKKRIFEKYFYEEFDKTVDQIKEKNPLKDISRVNLYKIKNLDYKDSYNDFLKDMNELERLKLPNIETDTQKRFLDDNFIEGIDNDLSNTFKT